MKIGRGRRAGNGGISLSRLGMLPRLSDIFHGLGFTVSTLMTRPVVCFAGNATDIGGHSVIIPVEEQQR
jgi:hypothetical protein